MKFLKLVPLFIVGSGIVAGCVSPGQWEEAVQTSKTGVSKTVTGPDGSPHEIIQCFAIEVCYRKASEDCAGRYRIVDNSTSYHDKDASSLTRLLVKCEAGPKK